MSMTGLSHDGPGEYLLHSTRSFTRMESPHARPPPKEQPTLDLIDASPEPPLPADSEGQGNGPDVFERRGSAESGAAGESQADEGFVLSRSLQDPSEELPIELISLTDR